MKRVIFELSMPNAGSWNGKWTGENFKYTVDRKFSEKSFKEIQFEIDKNYFYDFGDGWSTMVNVRLAKPREKTTNEFAGYDWMIASIIRHGEISV